MASNFSANDGLELIQTGEQANVWGASLNNTLNLVDQALDGTLIVGLSSPSYTLTVTDGTLSNGRNKVVEFTGAPGSPVTISITPVNISKLYWISNQTGQPMTVNNGSGSALLIPNSACTPCFCDGSGNVTALNSNSSVDTLTTSNLIVNNAAALPSGLATTIAGVSLQSYIASLIPALTALTGPLVISNIAAIGVPGGAWAIFTFGTVAGTRIRLGFTSGLLSSGSVIQFPAGFAVDGTNQIMHVSIGSANATAGNLVTIAASYNAATQQVSGTGAQSGGGSPGVNVAWFGMAWVTGY